jgi:formamidopyrimidine-DNA glycosylase
VLPSGCRAAALRAKRSSIIGHSRMPELPEVEIVRRGLEPVMVGQRIVRVEQRRADLRFPFPDFFVQHLEGRIILAVARRAKYLVVTLTDDIVLIMHLGMSGRFSIDPGPGSGLKTFGDYVYNTGAHAKHDHVVFALQSGARIVYNDPRRFGFMLLSSKTEWTAHPLFADLGVEPLGNELDAIYLARKAHGKRVDLKAFLLDQRIVAGLGNIYVSEALHRAGLSPHRMAGTLARVSGKPADRTARLVLEIRNVLHAAIDAGGSSLKDYRQTDGSSGGFQHEFAVYGRNGQRCQRPGCSGTIERTVQSQRATYACKLCQR